MFSYRYFKGNVGFTLVERKINVVWVEDHCTVGHCFGPITLKDLKVFTIL